jgi:hypothetical protein
MIDRRTTGATVAAALAILLCGLLASGWSLSSRPAKRVVGSQVETSISAQPNPAFDCILAEQYRWQIVAPFPTCPMRPGSRFSPALQ